MPITWLIAMWSANQRIRLYRKKHETRFYEWNGSLQTFGQIRVMSFRYPRWNPCTPSLHHMSPFGKHRHQLFTMPFNESPWFQFLAGALEKVLSRRFSAFWGRVGRVTGTKQLFCHGLKKQRYDMVNSHGRNVIPGRSRRLIESQCDNEHTIIYCTIPTLSLITINHTFKFEQDTHSSKLKKLVFEEWAYIVFNTL